MSPHRRGATGGRAGTANAESAIQELEERLDRYPGERYPVQRATAQFHLGVALTNAGRLEEAEAALTEAAGLFDPRRLPVEHAKAMNALGAALRTAGRLEEAAAILSRAAAGFEACGAAVEHGAASFNLALVWREAGDDEAAVEWFERARKVLEEGRALAEAAAAARELGATRFAAGDLPAATHALADAVSIAERAGDRAGLGASANALGLVHLAGDRPTDALAALETALRAHPRSLTPDGFAMVKANLALAHEQAGDDVRARLAARQALGVPAAPEPVRAQAAEVAERLGADPGDVLTVLDEEPADRWPEILREELARWVDADPAERRMDAAALIAGQLGRPELSVALAAAWLGALLELPPAAREPSMRSVVEALAERDGEEAERFRADTSMAMARFHIPQLLALRDGFNRIAAELGQEPAWT